MTTITKDIPDTPRQEPCGGQTPAPSDRSIEGYADLSPKDWAVMVNRHPAVVRQVLQIINDSYGSFSRPVASVQQAMAFLGFNTVKNLAGEIPAASVV